MHLSFGNIKSRGEISVIISEIQYHIRNWNLEGWSDLPKASI